MAYLIAVSSAAIDFSRDGNYRIAIRVFVPAGALADFKPSTLVKKSASGPLRETIISHQRTSPVCVTRFSSVAVPLSCIGAASTVKRIAHSVIKTVVNLYILKVKQNVKCACRRGFVTGNGGLLALALMYNFEALYTLGETLTPDMLFEM